MRILALDLSLTSSGYAIDDRFGTLPPPKGLTEGIPRIDWIMRQVLAMAKTGVDLVVIEGYAMGGGKTANHAHAKGELGGLVRWALWTKGIPYVDVPPKNLKRFAAGNGNANKELVLVEAVKRLGYNGSSSDEADALWLRAMAAQHYGRPVVKVPLSHLEGLTKVQWPAIRRKEADAA